MYNTGMKNADPVFNGPDQRLYYNAVQLALPLSTLIKVPDDDMLYSFLGAVRGVNFSRYVKPIRSNNTHSHDRGMLVKVLLFAYMNRIYSLEDIVQHCHTDIRFIYLSNEEKPSKMAFSRVANQLTESIDSLMRDLNLEIIDDTGIDPHTQFVDGTKIEANAYKNSFVYKKRILNAREDLFKDISKAVTSLNLSYGYSYEVRDRYCSLEIWFIVQYLMEVMVHENIEIRYGKGTRKSDIQKRYDILLGYAMRLSSYEYWLYVIGNRNSCSKTDQDATFMATKWDYYNRSGVTRPCYNCQIAVSEGFIVNSEIYQSPGDTVTWMPFMERFNRLYGYYPKDPVADAGYGGYDNYLFNIRHGIDLVQKFPMYGKEHDKRFSKNHPYNPFNWDIDDTDGFRICPNGRKFSQYEGDSPSRTRAGNLSILQKYTEPRHCEDCPLRDECIPKYNKRGYRQISLNVVGEQLKEEARAQLDSEKGIDLKIKRSEQAEGAFGVIKEDMRYTRFHRRGLKNVKMEFLLVIMGYNLRKYHHWRLFRQASGQPAMMS